MVPKITLKNETKKGDGRENNTPIMGDETFPVTSANFVCAYAVNIKVFDIKISWMFTEFLKLFLMKYPAVCIQFFFK